MVTNGGENVIGILCSEGKRQAYVDVLHPVFVGLSATSNLRVIVFSLSDVDLGKRSVLGISISSERQSVDAVPLPPVVYNLSVQASKQSIRKLRSLRREEQLELVNPTNRFRQQTVLEMVSTVRGMADYILPHKLSNQQGIYTQLHQGQHLLVIPSRGTSLGSLMYMQASGPYGSENHPREDDHLEAQLLRASTKAQWLIMQAPTLLLSGHRPVVVRVYMQKGLTHVWTVLAKRQLYTRPADRSMDGSVTSIALQAISGLSAFFPALGIAFVDFVFDTEGHAYLIRAGGWDSRLLRASELHWKLCVNVLGHASSLLTRQEASAHVD